MSLLAVWLLQVPLPPIGVASPDPPATSTQGVHEWTLGGVLKVKRYDYLTWRPVQDIRSRWLVARQPIFVFQVEPLRRNLVSFALVSAPALASGMPGVVNARLQLRVPGSTLRFGIDRGFVGGFTSAPLGNVGAFGSMRGAARGRISLSF